MFAQFQFAEYILPVVLFFIVANPATFKLVNGLVGKFVKTANGSIPTTVGLIVHALLFVVLSDNLSNLM